MGENLEDEHPLGPIVHSGDQPVAIPMNVEYRPAANDVGMRKVVAHFG